MQTQEFIQYYKQLLDKKTHSQEILELKINYERLLHGVFSGKSGQPIVHECLAKIKNDYNHYKDNKSDPRHKHNALIMPLVSKTDNEVYFFLKRLKHNIKLTFIEDNYLNGSASPNADELMKYIQTLANKASPVIGMEEDAINTLVSLLRSKHQRI